MDPQCVYWAPGGLITLEWIAKVYLKTLQLKVYMSEILRTFASAWKKNKFEIF